MSLEIRAKIICDKCGASIEGDIGNTSTDAQYSYWSAKEKAIRNHWMFNRRFGKMVHICHICADGGVKLEPLKGTVNLWNV